MTSADRPSPHPRQLPLTIELLRTSNRGTPRLIASIDDRLRLPRAHGECIDEFPMTVTGKVQKYRMREIAIEQLGLQQAAATTTA